MKAQYFAEGHIEFAAFFIPVSVGPCDSVEQANEIMLDMAKRKVFSPKRLIRVREAVDGERAAARDHHKP